MELDNTTDKIAHNVQLKTTEENQNTVRNLESSSPLLELIDLLALQIPALRTFQYDSKLFVSSTVCE